MNHYKVLDVSRSATQAEIRQAYLNAIEKNHPDRNCSESAATRAREINQAYEILGDPESRDHFNKTYHRAKVHAPYYPLEGHRRYSIFDNGYSKDGSSFSMIGVVFTVIVVALVVLCLINLFPLLK